MKQGFRTDLALENRAALGAEFDALPGVTYRSGMHEGIRVHRMVIETSEAADRLCKPIGTYDTLEMSAYLRRQDRGFSQTAQVLAEILREQLRLDVGEQIYGLGEHVWEIPESPPTPSDRYAPKIFW